MGTRDRYDERVHQHRGDIMDDKGVKPDEIINITNIDKYADKLIMGNQFQIQLYKTEVLRKENPKVMNFQLYENDNPKMYTVVDVGDGKAAVFKGDNRIQDAMELASDIYAKFHKPQEPKKEEEKKEPIKKVSVELDERYLIFGGGFIVGILLYNVFIKRGD
jgi:hypothetical protein